MSFEYSQKFLACTLTFTMRNFKKTSLFISWQNCSMIKSKFNESLKRWSVMIKINTNLTRFGKLWESPEEEEHACYVKTRSIRAHCTFIFFFVHNFFPDLNTTPFYTLRWFSLICSYFVVVFIVLLVFDIYSLLQKKITGKKLQCTDSFSPAEYDYEIQFLSTRPYFPKFYDKTLKRNKVGC